MAVIYEVALGEGDLEDPFTHESPAWQTLAYFVDEQAARDFRVKQIREQWELQSGDEADEDEDPDELDNRLWDEYSQTIDVLEHVTADSPGWTP